MAETHEDLAHMFRFDPIGRFVWRFGRPSALGTRFRDAAEEWSGDHSMADDGFRSTRLNEALVAFSLHPDQESALTDAEVFFKGSHSDTREKELAIRLSIAAAKYYPGEGRHTTIEETFSGLKLISWTLMVAFGCKISVDETGETKFEVLSKTERRQILRRLVRSRSEIEKLPVALRLDAFRTLALSATRADEAVDALIPALVSGAGSSAIAAVLAPASRPQFPELEPGHRWPDVRPLRALAIAWKNGVTVPRVTIQTPDEWDAVVSLLNEDALAFALLNQQEVPSLIAEAFHVNAKGLRWDNAFPGWAADYMAARFSKANSEVSYDPFGEIALRLCLRPLLADEVWERMLIDRASKIEEASKIDGRKEELDREREWFVNVIATHGGRVSVWRPLFTRWGQIKSIAAGDASWRSAADLAAAAGDEMQTVENALSGKQNISVAEANHLASLAAKDAASVRPVIDALAAQRENTERAWRARYVGERILAAAPRASRTILTIALYVTKALGRGRSARDLRRLVAKDPDGYWQVLREIAPNDGGGALTTMLQDAVCPVRHICYRVNQGKLAVVSQEHVAQMTVNGRSDLAAGASILIHLKGRGRGRKPTTIQSAFASEVTTLRGGHIDEFTGEGLFRIAGRIRPLTKTEVALIRHRFPKLDEQSEAELARRTKTVRDLEQRANHQAEEFSAMVIPLSQRRPDKKSLRAAKARKKSDIE